MELQRYEMGDYCSGYVPNDDGEVCMSYDVQRLEESHKELLNVLREMVAVYSGQVQNDGNYTVIDNLARVAITNAEGTK